jgi:hypothetical protein
LKEAACITQTLPLKMEKKIPRSAGFFAKKRKQRESNRRSLNARAFTGEKEEADPKPD